MNTPVCVALYNGDTFIVDIGEGGRTQLHGGPCRIGPGVRGMASFEALRDTLRQSTGGHR